MSTLYRKRLIPDECTCLKNDNILQQDENYIVTQWETLHPKNEFASGISLYVLNKGWKISKFYSLDHKLVYIYCDIIDTFYDKSADTYVFTDLLADVIIENDGFVHVVDLDELASACKASIISNEMLVTALFRLNELLQLIYENKLHSYLEILNKQENPV